MKAQTLVIAPSTIVDARLSVHEDEDILQQEIEIYKTVIADPQVSKEDPVKFWLGMKERLPNMAEHALVILAIPSNSSAVERSFSKYTEILAPRRSRLKEESIKQLNALYYNQCL